jgi:hypothetical protein
MKRVLRKDIRSLLSPVVMMGAVFLVLECLILAGVGMKNPKLISTCITLAVFAFAITLIYHLFLPGQLLLRNLRERQYFYSLRDEGVSKYRVLIWKFLYTMGSLVVFAALYIAALYLDIWIFGRAFPSEKEALEKFGVRKMIQGSGNDPFGPALAATIFEYVTMGLVLIALVFATVTFTYSLFHRMKLCGFNCLLVYLVMFGAFLKVYQATINGLTGTAAHVRAGVMQLVLAIAFFALALYMMRTIVPDEPTAEM